MAGKFPDKFAQAAVENLAEAAAGAWDTIDQFRSTVERGIAGRRSGTRAGRGDVRSAILYLLAEQPHHGYQLTTEIETRSNGTWKPSAGAIYPALQQLADEGLVTAEEDAGRKTYTLTDEGRAIADEIAASPAPWVTAADREPSRFIALPKAGVDLASAVSEIGRTGSSEQVEEAIEVLAAARRNLYAILSRE